MEKIKQRGGGVWNKRRFPEAREERRVPESETSQFVSTLCAFVLRFVP